METQSDYFVATESKHVETPPQQVIVVELTSLSQLSKLLLVGWSGSIKDAIDYYHKRFHREPECIQRYKANVYIPVPPEAQK